jgi:4-hydroxy-3-methylbut-2-en-1-yl diphosphate synthase IspG/GcpE
VLKVLVPDTVNVTAVPDVLYDVIDSAAAVVTVAVNVSTVPAVDDVELAPPTVTASDTDCACATIGANPSNATASPNLIRRVRKVVEDNEQETQGRN